MVCPPGKSMIFLQKGNREKCVEWPDLCQRVVVNDIGAHDKVDSWPKSIQDVRVVCGQVQGENLNVGFTFVDNIRATAVAIT